MKNKFIYKIVMLAITVLAVMPVISQPTLPSDPSAAPIDGGLSLLVAGGVGYGIKKIREKRKK